MQQDSSTHSQIWPYHCNFIFFFCKKNCSQKSEGIMNMTQFKLKKRWFQIINIECTKNKYCSLNAFPGNLKMLPSKIQNGGTSVALTQPEIVSLVIFSYDCREIFQQIKKYFSKHSIFWAHVSVRDKRKCWYLDLNVVFPSEVNFFLCSSNLLSSWMV